MQSVLDAKTDPAGRLYVLSAETMFPGTPAAPAKYTLFRFTADGAPDSSLGGGTGEIALDVPKAPARIAVEADGSVLVGGTRRDSPADAQVARIPVSALGAAPAAPGGGGGAGAAGPRRAAGRRAPSSPRRPSSQWRADSARRSG